MLRESDNCREACKKWSFRHADNKGCRGAETEEVPPTHCTLTQEKSHAISMEGQVHTFDLCLSYARLRLEATQCTADHIDVKEEDGTFLWQIR